MENFSDSPLLSDKSDCFYKFMNDIYKRERERAAAPFWHL